MILKRKNGSDNMSAKRSKSNMEPQESMDFSNFEQIPRDLAWEIIKYAPKMVYKLRLTSRIVKSWVDGYSLLRPLQTPLTEKLILIGSSDPSKPLAISFVVGRNAKLFNLRLVAEPPIGMIQQMKKHRKTGTPKNVEPIMKYKLAFAPDTENEDKLYHLRNCLGSRIENVAILHCNDFVASALTKLFDGAKLSKIMISSDSISDTVAAHLSNMLESCKVDEVSLDVKTISAFDPAKLLVDLSSVVRALYVNQHRTFGRDCTHLFESLDEDWASIILRMFAGRMDKLLINSSHQEFLDGDNAEMLRKRLPMLGKPIWFDATCSAYREDFEYTVNGHRVRADGNKRLRFESSLRVVHTSRVAESYEISF